MRVSARQQIAAGDREAALETLRRGLALDAGDPAIDGMLADLTRTARRAATEAGAAAARRGQRSHTAFRDAQAREREADSLLRAGDRVPAIQALWAASSRYSDVPPRQQAPAPSPAPVPASPPVTRAEPPASVPASPPITTEPPPAPKPVPAPAEPRAVPPSAAARTPPPNPNAENVAAIRDTLRRYTQAYQSLESQAVASVMPSLTAGQLRSLERDFSNYRSYTVEIRNERIVVETMATATVTCEVVRSFETRSGVSQTHTFDSIFHLRQQGSAWTIERIESR